MVTGASGGIGRGIALALGTAGATVVIAARRERESSEVVDALRNRDASAASLPCDVSDRASVDGCIAECLQRFGRLDTVVHNAASSVSSTPTTFETVAEAEWREHASVSLRGSVWLASACFDPLRAQRGSLIVLTSASAVDGHPSLSLYAAAKGAQQAFALTLAREWGPFGVRVNCLAPHADSPAQRRFARSHPAEYARELASLPLGRLGDPEFDIGSAVAFLASPHAAYITGQVVAVDGGRSVRA